MEYKVGDAISEYLEITDVLRGGFGIVYIVYDRRFGGIYALKSFQDRFLRIGDKEADESVRTFYHEAEVWIKLGKHENIVEAQAVEEVDYKPHILMEYMDGGNLKKRLERGPLDVLGALLLAIQFCDGMIHANSVDLGGGRRGIVHRDIKPSNIMLTKEGIVKITDFGLVKALRFSKAERITGTPEYMSPEQFETMDVDACSDVYSFGLVLYEMLAGRRPFPEPEDTSQRWEFCRYQHQEVLPRPLRELGPLIPQELERVLTECLEKDPDDRYRNFETMREELIAVYSSQFGQFKPALDLTKVVLRNEKKELVLKGYSLFSLGKQQEAIEIFDEALKTDREYDEAWIGKGGSLSRLGKYEEGIDCLNRALELNPRHALALVWKASALGNLSKYAEAIECYDRALEIDPRYARAWAGKGYSLVKLGRYQEGLECLDRSLGINPRLSEAWSSKGNAFRELGRCEEAVECYDRALDIRPKDGEKWTQKGAALGILGRYKETIECCDKALEIDPEIPQAYVNKGVALDGLRKYDEAIQCHDRALQINPRIPEAWAGKGNSLISLERYQEAVECCEMALKLDPRDAKSWGNKGIGLDELGKHEEAIASFDKALAIDPTLAGAWRGKGIALGRLGRHRNATECLDKAIQIDPRDAYSWVNKGVSLYQLGQVADAMKCFQRAIELDPSMRKRLGW